MLKAKGSKESDKDLIVQTFLLFSIQSSYLKVRLGDYDINSNNEPHNYIERNVNKIIIHPKYNPPSFKNDPALLKLHTPVTFSPTVLPICYSDNDKYLAGEIGWVTGWGSQYGKNFFSL